MRIEKIYHDLGHSSRHDKPKLDQYSTRIVAVFDLNKFCDAHLSPLQKMKAENKVTSLFVYMNTNFPFSESIEKVILIILRVMKNFAKGKSTARIPSGPYFSGAINGKIRNILNSESRLLFEYTRKPLTFWAL